MKYRLLLSFILLLTIKNVAAQSIPSVVVSIKPIHSIVSALMSGIAEPQLLLKSNNSAHTFHLKPSQVRMIANADLVIIISEDFEFGLRKAIKNIENDSLFQITSLGNLNIHKSRSEILYSKEHEEHEEHEEHDKAPSAEHAEFIAEYHLECKQLNNLTTINVNLFEFFPAISDLDVQVIYSGGQIKQELNVNNTLIKLAN